MITAEYYQYGNFLSVRDSSLYEKIIPEKGILITKFLFAENRFYACFFDDFAFSTRAEALAPGSIVPPGKQKNPAFGINARKISPFSLRIIPRDLRIWKFGIIFKNFRNYIKIRKKIKIFKKFDF